jgi:hypothetical protein
VRITVAERDPGIGGNWIDSFGHVAGVMGLRLIKTSETPPVAIHLVELRDLERVGAACLGPATAQLSDVTA